MSRVYKTNTETIEKLMVEVGNRCRGPKFYEASISLRDGDDGCSTWFKPIFFRALVNLQVLELKYFNCDDKALEQFAIHTKNLV